MPCGGADFDRQFLLKSLLNLSGKIKILFSLDNVFYFDDQSVSLNGSVQWRRVAAALDFVNQDRFELLPAVFANHNVTGLMVAFSGRPTDVTGIEGGTDDTVRAFYDEIFDFSSLWSYGFLG